MMTIDRLDELELLFMRQPNSPNINDAGREMIAELRQRGLARAEISPEPQPVAADGSPIPTPAPSSESEKTPTPVSDAATSGEEVPS